MAGVPCILVSLSALEFKNELAANNTSSSTMTLSEIVDENPKKERSPIFEYPPIVKLAPKKLWLPIFESWQIVEFDQIRLFEPTKVPEVSY